MYLELFFYLLSISACISAFMTISSKNTVQAVLWLIYTFFNVAGLLLIIGAEFIAMMLVIVYVGAVAVLFLFVIMMIDIRIIVPVRNSLWSATFSFGIVLSILLELLIALSSNFNISSDRIQASYKYFENVTNTEAIGRILYTDFLFHFQIASLILFVSMIGAISLTLKYANKKVVKSVSVNDIEGSVRLIKIKSGEGIDV